MFRVVTVPRAISVMLGTVACLALSAAPSASAGTAQSDSATVGTASVGSDAAVAAVQSGAEVTAQSATGGAGINRDDCQTRGWPYYYQVRCRAWSASIYYAWINCTSLSSSWPSYRAVSGPRHTAGLEWGVWTEQLTCSPSTEYYISNAGYDLS
jgi:hypothetical protein